MSTSKTPLVSVLMSAYNDSDHLAQAMQSLTRQTFTDFEMIIVDDASSDGSLTILEKSDDPRVRIIKNNKNIGLTKSLNKGLGFVRGKYIARHDADDISHPERFQRQVKFLRSHTEVGLLGTNYEMIDDDGRILEMVELPETDSLLRRRLSSGNVFCHGSVMVRSQLLFEAGGYREAFPVTQDFDLWLRLAERAKIANLPDFLYKFRFRANTVSRRDRPRQLAYKSLALELARQRRESGKEEPIPADVMQVFPATELELFRAALGNSFMYFSAGKISSAEENLKIARELSDSAGWERNEWKSWIIGRAQRIAELQSDPAPGEEFIRWCLKELPDLIANGIHRNLLSEYFAWLLFRKSGQESGKSAVQYAIRVLQHDPARALDRGFWSNTLRSIVS